MTKNNNYKKTILMTLLIVPLFIAVIGIASFQNAHAGFLCGDPIPSVDPAVIDETLQPGESHVATKVFEPNDEGCGFVGFAEPPFIQAQECFDSGFDANILVDAIQDNNVQWTETITVNGDAEPGRYHCPIIWQLQYFDLELNGFADNVFGQTDNGPILFTETVTQQIWITVTEPRPDEGCTPGFWKQKHHLGHWAPTGLSPEDTLASQFFVTAATPEASLLEALSLKGGKGIAGAEHILLRTAVAALLNAAHPDVGYPLTAEEVRTYVSGALEEYDRETLLELKDMFDESNNAVCPLEGQSPEPTTCVECNTVRQDAIVLCEDDFECEESAWATYADCTFTCTEDNEGTPARCFNEEADTLATCIDDSEDLGDIDVCVPAYFTALQLCAAD